MGTAEKIVNILLWVLLIVSAVLVISMMANINVENEADPRMGGWINTVLVWSYILFALGAGIALVAGLVHMVTDIKAAKKGLLSLLVLGVVVLIAFLLASDEIPQFLGAQRLVDEGILTSGVAKLVDAGLYTTYILLALAALSVALSPVARLLNR